MKKFLKSIVLLVALLLIIYFIYAKFFNNKNENKYLTIMPIRGDLVYSVVAAGEVMPQELVDVGAQVSGQIKKLFVKLGDKVKKGDNIAQIDSVKQENEIAKLQAQDEILKADLNANLVALKISKIKYLREKELFEKDATSKESLENAQNDLALKEAKQVQIKAQISKNKIDLDTAKTNLSYTKITSPLDGTIVSIPVKEGQTVNANQSTPTIVQVADLSKMEINMEVSEGDLPKVKVGLEVRYSILGDTKRIISSKVSSIDPAMIALSDGSYSKQSSTKSGDSAVYYYAKFLVDNEDNFLKIGMTTQNNIILKESKNTIYIPKSLIYEKENKYFVQVLENQEAVERRVTLGISNEFYQEIKSGLDIADEVISDVSGNIKNGKKQAVRLRL